MGGELPGAWVFVHEHAPKGQKNTYLGFLTASVVGGIMLGSLVYLLTYTLFDSKEVADGAGVCLLRWVGCLALFRYICVDSLRKRLCFSR